MSHLYDLAISFAKRKTGTGYYRGYPTPTTTWKDACGALTNQFELYIGGWSTAPSLYGPNASDVMRRSGTRNNDASKAPINAIHWFSLEGEPAGHVMVDLNGGGTDCLSASGRVAKVKLAPYLVIQSVAGYDATPGVTYEGWTTNYGGGISKYREPAPVVKPNQRVTVSPAGANVRSGPSTASPITSVLKGSTIVTVLGYEHGGSAAGSDLWFKHAAGYSHVSGFTDKSTHDLVDLTPKPVPAPDPVPPVLEPEPPVEEPVPPVESTPDDVAPNWFVRFIQAIIDALTTWLTRTDK